MLVNFMRNIDFPLSVFLSKTSYYCSSYSRYSSLGKNYLCAVGYVLWALGYVC